MKKIISIIITVFIISHAKAQDTIDQAKGTIYKNNLSLTTQYSGSNGLGLGLQYDYRIKGNNIFSARAYKNNYHFSFGMGYKYLLINKSKFTIGAGVVVNYELSNYSNSRIIKSNINPQFNLDFTYNLTKRLNLNATIGIMRNYNSSFSFQPSGLSLGYRF